MRPLVIIAAMALALPTAAGAKSSQRARYEEAWRLSVELKQAKEANCRRVRQQAQNEPGNVWNLSRVADACNPYDREALPRWEDCEPACQVVTLGMLKDLRAKLEAARRGPQ